MKSSRSATSHAEREGILAVPTEQSTIGISPADAWLRDGMSRAEADVLATEIIAGAEAVATSPGIRTAYNSILPSSLAGPFSQNAELRPIRRSGATRRQPGAQPGRHCLHRDQAVFELLAC